MAGCVPYTCHPSYSRKDLGLGCPCHKVRSYLQNNQRKKAGGIVQKVAHQPNKSEALNSNLSTTKKRKEKKKSQSTTKCLATMQSEKCSPGLGEGKMCALETYNVRGQVHILLVNRNLGWPPFSSEGALLTVFVLFGFPLKPAGFSSTFSSRCLSLPHSQ
jgi:hypothetical protein